MSDFGLGALRRNVLVWSVVAAAVYMSSCDKGEIRDASVGRPPLAASDPCVGDPCLRGSYTIVDSGNGRLSESNLGAMRGTLRVRKDNYWIEADITGGLHDGHMCVWCPQDFRSRTLSGARLLIDELSLADLYYYPCDATGQLSRQINVADVGQVDLRLVRLCPTSVEVTADPGSPSTIMLFVDMKSQDANWNSPSIECPGPTNALGGLLEVQGNALRLKGNEAPLHLGLEYSCWVGSKYYQWQYITINRRAPQDIRLRLEPAGRLSITFETRKPADLEVLSIEEMTTGRMLLQRVRKGESEWTLDGMKAGRYKVSMGFSLGTSAGEATIMRYVDIMNGEEASCTFEGM